MRDVSDVWQPVLRLFRCTVGLGSPAFFAASTAWA